MGQMLKSYISKHYAPGKRDLYAAFILRNIGLTNKRGRVAMVTQQSWMFLSSFADLRLIDDKEKKKAIRGTFKGLLRETTIEALAHLGPYAFKEISGEVVKATLFIISNTPPIKEHKMIAFRLIGPKNPERKPHCCDKHFWVMLFLWFQCQNRSVL